ncbi:MAG TPA: tyrosine-type recombinase/integrase [Thermoanaerobaculia bacterium]|jgi:integrase|nr:tyrosine-type recombinase/integrase [Thermoanaerobaculia bacterium]
MPKLTKRTVDALKPRPGRDLVVFDSEVSGFGVRIKPSGRKSYLIQYRNAGGRSRRLTIAGHGRMTAEEARDEAKQLLAAAARGQDPAEDRHRALRAPTVAQLAALYLERHARPRKKTAIADESMLRRYVLPAFGARKVEAITRGDVARLHHELGDKPLAANRVLALISVMFNLAESWGLRAPASNPCRHLKRYPERKRDRFLSAEEVQRLGEALLEAQGIEHPSALAAIRLLLLTGARKSEILTLKWEHVDLERYALRLPDSKTGAKVIALGGAAAALLARLDRREGNPYVCWGNSDGGHFIGLQHVWQRIRRRARLPEVRLHDARHSYASFGAAAGLGLPVIGALLGHKQPITTARYAHLANDPLRAAADRITGEIAAALDGRPLAEVLPLRNTANPERR